jgi:hypothetical protein
MPPLGSGFASLCGSTACQPGPGTKIYHIAYAETSNASNANDSDLARLPFEALANARGPKINPADARLQ